MYPARILALAATAGTALLAQSATTHLTTIFDFPGSGNGIPLATPVMSAQGNLYGTTADTVFELTSNGTGKPWSETVLFTWSSSQACSSATSPPIRMGVPLAIGSKGELFGMTSCGGSNGSGCDANGCGTVFVLYPPAQPGGGWTKHTIHQFSGSPDGANPYGGVLLTRGGDLLGVTVGGGASGNGTVFALAPPSTQGAAWIETVLHNFAGAPSDGARPFAPLVVSPNQLVYGATSAGGSGGFGTVFQMTPPATQGGAWSEATIYNFLGVSANDLEAPYAGLLAGRNGALFGTAYNGGLGAGGAFELEPPTTQGGPWMEAVIHRFVFKDGAHPVTGLTLGGSGALVGTAQGGGKPCGAQKGCGTVIRLTPPRAPGGNWHSSVIYEFTPRTGHEPFGVVIDRTGKIFGANAGGGTLGAGTIFEIGR